MSGHPTKPKNTLTHLMLAHGGIVNPERAARITFHHKSHKNNPNMTHVDENKHICFYCIAAFLPTLEEMQIQWKAYINDWKA